MQAFLFFITQRVNQVKLVNRDHQDLLVCLETREDLVNLGRRVLRGLLDPKGRQGYLDSLEFQDFLGKGDCKDCL